MRFNIPLTTKRKLVTQAPTLLPKKKRDERRVFLLPEVWAQLDEAQDFHQAVFDALGAAEKVSRNDMIESFVKWAVDAYWEDKGGRPQDKKDFAEKVRRHAEKLQKLQR